ncbi:hypothetical protein SDC9_79088 [bioreactor metagenome]|uniref:Uncharacterized protein n=1 Tax=bioreactor metagenome TaxID=1076179 RepID=A0A644YVB2_9ZZZZ
MKKIPWGKVAEVAARYFDDLLVLSSGACFTSAAAVAFGLAAALATAGVCLGVYAYIVGRARGGR